MFFGGKIKHYTKIVCGCPMAHGPLAHSLKTIEHVQFAYN